MSTAKPTTTTSPPASNKIKYINNKELLGEIHRSKKTYCYYIEPQYADHDIIVQNVSDITPELIQAVREKKAKPRGKPAVDINTILPENIVVRVMTYEHIPLDPDRVRKSRVTDQSYARTNFPPFKHYILLEDGPKEVLRSHWQDGFDNGKFAVDGPNGKGKINDRLARMFMMLVERYSRRGNWRGYCVDEQTEALTQRGWLNHNEITTDDIILSYENGQLKWSKIKSIYRDNYNGNMFHLTGTDIDSLVTPGHKFVTTAGLKEVEHITNSDVIVLMGDSQNIESKLGNTEYKSIPFSEISKKETQYNRTVWCPETEFGSFIAKRNGTIYLTGNSYVDEMRSQALLQLSQIGLQFDESKSDNPFAFYTTAIRNCLSGETLILTKEHGSIAIKDVVGKYVTLLDGNGDWLNCLIRDYGQQTTQKIIFNNGGGHIEEVWSTFDHGWVKSDGKRINTNEFGGRNTKIADLRPEKNVENLKNYNLGIKHGIIYGDGSKYGQNDFEIILCGEKIELANYFCDDKQQTAPYLIEKSFLGFTVKSSVNLKEFPSDPGKDLDYLKGFIRGWFSTDGCLSKSKTATLCGDEAEYNWLKTWGPLIGWHVNGFTKLAEKTNYGVRNKISLNFHIRKSSLDECDFIRSKHKERWGDGPTSRIGKGEKYNWEQIDAWLLEGKTSNEIAELLNANVKTLRSLISQRKKKNLENVRHWMVYGSRQTNETRDERVYCPVVETTNSFALSSGIHSRQCFTRVLNLEKKSQNIRDDLLVIAGAAPSYTRQADNELDTKFADYAAQQATKDGVTKPE